MEIILASSSPRRIELLSRLVEHFSVVASDVDETVDVTLSPEAMVALISRRKAETVAATHGHCAVIGADTLVALEGDVLGKPGDEAEAERMLMRLQGQWHQVFTGVTVMAPGRMRTEVVSTRVQFAPMSREEIRAYIATGEPMDKAGAYGIQGLGGAYICAINGNYENVMGLPLYHLRTMLLEMGIKTL